MTSCCPPPRMPWSGATGAIARCKRVSTGCGRTSRSVRAWRWTCGVKPTPKAGNKPSPPFIVHGLDKPGGFTTVSIFVILLVLWLLGMVTSYTLVVLGRNNPSLYTVNGRPLYVHLNGLAIVLLK